MITAEHIDLQTDDLHVWVCRDKKIHKLAEEESRLLTESERRKAAELRFEEDRDRFVSGRILMKKLLGAYLRTDPEKVAIYRTPAGKPFVEDHSGLQFNMSHSGDRVLLCFASTCSVGVDVEKVRRDISIESICRGHFTREECQRVLDLRDENHRAEEFCRIWTRKEAVIKCVGKGLQIPLKSFCVSGSSGAVRWQSGAVSYQQECHVADIQVGAAYKAAAAIAGSQRKIRVYEYEL